MHLNKIWFVLINEKREGPFSFDDLQNDSRLTPDTLIWKEGFQDWKKIRDVPELKKLFKDPEEVTQTDDKPAIFDKKSTQNELVMDFSHEPPYFLWLLIALIAFFYVILRLYTLK